LRDRLVKVSAWSDGDRFLACWAGVWFCFFSLASTKLPNYVLPMYPALALIMARFLKDWQSSVTPFDARVFRNCCRVLGGVGACAAIGIPIAISLLMPGEEWLLVIGIIPLVGATMAYIYCWWGQRERAIYAIVASAVLLAVSVVGIAPSRLAVHQDSPRIAEAARSFTGKTHPDIGVVEGFSPSLVYYAQKPVKPLQPAKVAKYLHDHPDAVILTRADRMELLPEDAAQLTEVARVRRFLRPYDLVLLARPTTMAAQPGATKN
jgi:4-amino-4-deoxy-L-arabinose transferase-like glycosyltransferase